MPRHDQYEARNQQKQELAHQRLKERVLGYVNDLKRPNDIISMDELITVLKKHGEYARQQNKHIERQAQEVLDAQFADINCTNIRKQFYKKKDLVKGEEDVRSDEQKPVIDEFGEELVEHKSKNMMNNMLPLMAKDGILGKRPSEANINEQ
jgi:hypothetical protein